MGSLTSLKNELNYSCKINSSWGIGGEKVIWTEFYTLINLEVHL